MLPVIILLRMGIEADISDLISNALKYHAKDLKPKDNCQGY